MLLKTQNKSQTFCWWCRVSGGKSGLWVGTRTNGLLMFAMYLRYLPAIGKSQAVGVDGHGSLVSLMEYFGGLLSCGDFLLTFGDVVVL